MKTLPRVRLRDGATRARPYIYPGYERCMALAAHRRDEGLAKLEKRLLNATRPKLLRFDTSGKAFLHNQDPEHTFDVWPQSAARHANSPSDLQPIFDTILANATRLEDGENGPCPSRPNSDLAGLLKETIR